MLTTLLLALALAASPAADHEWERTFDLDGRGVLDVRTSDADVRVTPWEGDSIEVRVTSHRLPIGKDGVQVHAEQSGNRVKIEVHFPRFSNSRARAEIEVRMPREADLEIRTQDGDVEVDGTHGAVAVASGDGDIRLRSIEGTLEAHTGDGDVDIRGIFRSLEVKTGDGEIDVEALAGSSIDSPWSLRSGDGDLTLGLPEAFAAELDVSTGDGDLDLDVPLTVSGSISGRRGFRGTLNGGGELLSLRTGDGSIRLTNSR